MTTKHEIEIPDLPEGWRAVAYRTARRGIDHVLRNGQVTVNKLLCFMWSCQFSQGNFMTDWFNAPHEYITEYTECKHCGGLNPDNQN